MKILIADKVSAKMVADLKALGCDVALEPDVSAEALPASLAGVEILIVRSKQVTAAAIEAGSSLSLIIRAGAGVNTIDIQKASEKGIYVANCPGKNTDAAAKVGKLIAERAKAAGIEKVAFDRSGYRFHGRVKALAEAAREGGLQF